MNFDRPIKVMIHEAYSIFTLKREGAGGDPDAGRNWAIARYVWAGHVMAAVENQPAPFGQLLQFCCAPEYRDMDFNMLHNILLSEFMRKFKVKQHRAYLRVCHLIEVALYDYKLSTQGQRLTIEEICEQAGLDRSNFYKHERQWSDKQSYNQWLRR